jgi:hypothetical protein
MKILSQLFPSKDKISIKLPKITETTSADARQLINKMTAATSMKDVVKKIERSHDKDKIDSKSNNFNLTVNSMKTLETFKANKDFTDELLN